MKTAPSADWEETMNLLEMIKDAGVIGAGGAGFPTHVKLASKAAALKSKNFSE